MKKSLSSSQRAVLTSMVRGKILWDASLSAWTTYRIGGPADALVTLLDVQDLQDVLGFCRREAIDWKLLGRGSNLLAPDEGFRGIVMVLGEGFKTISRRGESGAERVLVDVGAAVGMTRLANWCGGEGLTGLEFAAGIPGSVGGAVVMNAGAWGRSMGDVVDAVEAADEAKSEIIRAKNISFSYRSFECPGIDRNEAVITGVVLKLTSGIPELINEKIRDLQARRKKSQPHTMANAGSVFRNPEGASAGKLIDDAGLKGLRVGDAVVSEKHGNFIINCGNASARDVMTLIAEVQGRVQRECGIELETEIEIL